MLSNVNLISKKKHKKVLFRYSLSKRKRDNPNYYFPIGNTYGTRCLIGFCDLDTQSQSVKNVADVSGKDDTCLSETKDHPQ